MDPVTDHHAPGAALVEEADTAGAGSAGLGARLAPPPGGAGRASVAGTVRAMEVDAAAIKQHGASVCALADQLREIRDRWDRQTNAPAGALGYREVTDDYQKADSGWYAELTVYVDVLDELCAALCDTADDYRNTDADNARQLLL